MISVNDANYIDRFPIFRTFQSFSYFKYKPLSNKFISILLILLQMLVKLFFNNRIIDILYNLNKHL